MRNIDYGYYILPLQDVPSLDVGMPIDVHVMLPGVDYYLLNTDVVAVAVAEVVAAVEVVVFRIIHH